MKENEAIIFSDGASRGNPGPGGWAYIVSHAGTVTEGGGAEQNTTNNRMELSAAIEALHQAHKDGATHVVLHTDSAYVVNGATKWLSGWQENDWTTKTKEAVKNEDLWKLLAQKMKGVHIKWVRVSGHAGVPGNERVDEIATAYADGNKMALYRGPQNKYTYDLSKIIPAKEKKSSKARKGEAYSYVSVVGGKVEIHKTWKECEARVKGVSGARYKKALSKEDEDKISLSFL